MKEIPDGSPEIEVVWQAIRRTGARSVAVASPDPGQGASTVALALARRAGSRGGPGAVLVDANRRRSAFPGAVEPGVGVASADGVEMIAVPDGDEGWREARDLRERFHRLAGNDGFVVVDCAPLLSGDAEPVPGAVAAAAAEAAILVSMAGANPANRIAAAAGTLSRAGATFVGVVINDARNPPLSSELERLAAKLARIFPPAGRWLAARLRKSALLGIGI